MKRLLPAGLSLLLLCGCAGDQVPQAADASSATQTIMVNTPGVEGAMCIVQNGRGSWNIPAPGPVTVPRTPSALTINCFKGDHLRGSGKVAASFAPAEAGAGTGCVSCRYPGIVDIALRLNDSMMDVPVIRQMP